MPSNLIYMTDNKFGHKDTEGIVEEKSPNSHWILPILLMLDNSTPMLNSAIISIVTRMENEEVFEREEIIQELTTIGPLEFLRKYRIQDIDLKTYRNNHEKGPKRSNSCTMQAVKLPEDTQSPKSEATGELLKSIKEITAYVSEEFEEIRKGSPDGSNDKNK